MTKWWETVLGQRVLFLEDPDGGWQWQSEDMDVKQDPNVKFRSLQAARLACAAMVYAFFVMEEVTSTSVPSSISPFAVPADGPTHSPTSPPQGSGGENN